MTANATDFADFYRSALGIATSRLVRRKLREFWPALATENILGLGYPNPYLDLWRLQATRTISIIPSQLWHAHRPRYGATITATAEEDALPIADLSVDRVLVVHGLEHADSARRMLREIWRILAPAGRLVVIVPNRASIWAYLQRTPFGYGQPYTALQLEDLLKAVMFQVERRGSAVYVPPLRFRPLLRGAEVMERVGQRALPGMSGVIMIEAAKDVAGLIPTIQTRRRVIVESYPHGLHRQMGGTNFSSRQ